LAGIPVELQVFGESRPTPSLLREEGRPQRWIKAFVPGLDPPNAAIRHEKHDTPAAAQAVR
jgi:hypothetical protein